MVKVNCAEGRCEVRGRDFSHELSAVKGIQAAKRFDGAKKVWIVEMGCLEFHAAMLGKGLVCDVMANQELHDAAVKARWAWEENHRFFN